MSNVQELTDEQVFARLAETMSELRRRALISTGNAPTGDYAELLAERAFGGTREMFSHRGWDVRGTARFGNLQVKAATRLPGRTPGFSPIRDVEKAEFEYVLLVVFDRETWRVLEAQVLPLSEVVACSHENPHVRGRKISLAKVRASDQTVDVTNDIQRAQAWTNTS